MYELGLFASEENRIEDSKKWYKKAAEKGETTAMNNLANIYSEEGNKEEAMKLYLKSAEKGNPLAFFNLGNYYEENNDIELAKEYYDKVLDSLKGYPTSKLEQEAVNRLKKLQNEENN